MFKIQLHVYFDVRETAVGKITQKKKEKKKDKSYSEVANFVIERGRMVNFVLRRCKLSLTQGRRC